MAKARLFKVLRWSGGGLLAMALLAVLLVYGLSQRVIATKYDVQGQDLALPTSPEALLLGEKIARTRGCVGCHRSDAGGRQFIDDWKLASVAAPNLTQLVHERSVAELDRSIRQGVRDDGRSVIIMPSAMYHQLADAEVAAVIAWLRTLPRIERDFGERSFGPLARLGFALGDFKTERMVIPEYPPLDASTSDPVGKGKYLVHTTCTECHGADLGGKNRPRAPDLVVAAAYSPDNFSTLLREGLAQGGKELKLMKTVALTRFAYFDDEEIAAIHAYLSSPEFLATRQ
ncbi:MAG: cytochrome c [Gammaproteobacteria bacterium]|nr:cytochrome c [Gammaproteobacteria bacterium]